MKNEAEIPEPPEAPVPPVPNAKARELLDRLVEQRKAAEAAEKPKRIEQRIQQSEKIDPDEFKLLPNPGGLRILSNDEIEKAKREEQEKARLGYWNQVVPVVYSEPFDFSKCKSNPEAVRRVLGWKHSARGLYIIGSTGSGKSRAVANAIKPYFMAGGSVRYLSGVEFSEQCTQITLEGKGIGKWKHDLCNAGILWIDDLGKRWTRATEEECFSIVEERTSRGRPILITTNYDRDQMLAKAHDRETMEPLLRRFRDFMEVIDFEQ